MKSREQIKKDLQTPIGYSTLLEMSRARRKAPPATKALMGLILCNDETAPYCVHIRNGNYILSTEWNGSVYLRTVCFSDYELQNPSW